MPKKFAGENTKAAAARAKKVIAKKEEAERRKQAEEDAKWVDDDKNVARKLQRKEEAERKRLETLQRKQLNKQALEDEMSTLTGKDSSTKKVTRAAIDEFKHLEEAKKEEEEKQKLLQTRRIEIEKKEIEENVNRLEVEGDTARTVTDAIRILSVGPRDEVDRHPEKRLKAAYQEFEEKMLPRLKEEYPTYRLSQLKQVLKKQWQKSPDNPLNRKILDIVQ